ncbi:hypothetical protein ABT026_31690 [Streptomyces sp. NPDC002734]|uniref:hypothetical protein n=1 Tax=Streptomyces sp. NPDC002734 TaxID=3154426 RepID=UPI00332BA4FC
MPGALLTQADPLACFANAARRLRPGGFFTRTIHPARQHYVSDSVVLSDGRLHHVRVTFRHASPGELGLMAAAARPRLRTRTGGWSGTPSKDSSSHHLSAYELPERLS